jgi:hypothetical protein
MSDAARHGMIPVGLSLLASVTGGGVRAPVNLKLPVGVIPESAKVSLQNTAIVAKIAYGVAALAAGVTTLRYWNNHRTKDGEP